MVLEFPVLLPQHEVLPFLPPCYWCAPRRPFLYPSPWLCLAVQVHVALNLAGLSPAYTLETRKVK